MTRPHEDQDLRDNQNYTAIRTYRQSEKQRLRNRRAQKAFRERARQRKELGQDAEVAASGITQAWESLESDRAAFAAERQVWLSSASQALLNLGTWLAPSIEGLAVTSDDSFKVAVLRTPGISDAFLDVLFSTVCQSCNIVGYPCPAKAEVDFWPISSYLTVRSHIGRTALALAVEDAETEGSCRSLARLEDLIASWRGIARLSRMTDRSAGGDLARIMYKMVKQFPLDQYGQPPANHWHIATARARLSPEQRAQMLAMQARFHDRLFSTRQRATTLPRRLHGFLQGDVDPRLTSYPSAMPGGQEGEALLAELLKEEHAAANAFYWEIRQQVLTPLQDARINLAAFPWQPDLDIICSVLRGWDDYPDMPAGIAQPSCIVREAEEPGVPPVPQAPQASASLLPKPCSLASSGPASASDLTFMPSGLASEPFMPPLRAGGDAPLTETLESRLVPATWQPPRSGTPAMDPIHLSDACVRQLMAFEKPLGGGGAQPAGSAQPAVDDLELLKYFGDF
ncbi:hypothetical protein WJX73_009992 [Symbiochloris irregularis]|uniref:BZIP domain-containing protein n=1 Tax=Symbiochloris irregularis TaxID=706552 RepID=A0AAW1PSI4_9CHLO